MQHRIISFAALFAGTALFAAAPALAQPVSHANPPHPAPFHAAARPGLHSMPHAGWRAQPHAAFHYRPGAAFRVGPHGGVRFAARGFHPLRAAIARHASFAHFTPAERAHWIHGRWYHRWYRGHYGWWWYTGGLWFWYNAPVYPYPTVVSDDYYEEPEVEGPTWWYCYNPAGYYPYIPSCDGPWQPVPAPDYGEYDEGGPDQGPPPGDEQYQNGPPPSAGQEQGPPPGYAQGPNDQSPSGYDQGPPPGYDQGRPPGYDQGPPPGYDQGPGDEQGQTHPDQGQSNPQGHP